MLSESLAADTKSNLVQASFRDRQGDVPPCAFEEQCYKTTK